MSEAKFVCECDETHRSACTGLEFYREVNGKKYCVLHCPVPDKAGEFNEVLRHKLSSRTYNFRGVYFPGEVGFEEVNFVSDAYFDGATFSADANFRSATFSNFASFYKATFNAKAHFKFAKFSADAIFISAKFSTEGYFTGAIFSAAAYFSSAKFSAAVYFNEATFSAIANFKLAKIESYWWFGETIFAETASLDLQWAHVSKPEQVVFHTIRLRPHWFVNVDSRKFEFTNIDWVGFDPSNLPWQEKAIRKLKRARVVWSKYIKHGVGSETLHAELQALNELKNHHHLLSIAYRRLATNAEDNNRYGEAARFRYASMDARRLEQWRGWNIFTLDWWYWLVSGYGERIPRAMICLLVLLLGFSFLYTKVGFETKEVAPIVQEMMPPPAPRKDLPLPSFIDLRDERSFISTARTEGIYNLRQTVCGGGNDSCAIAGGIAGTGDSTTIYAVMALAFNICLRVISTEVEQIVVINHSQLEISQPATATENIAR